MVPHYRSKLDQNACFSTLFHAEILQSQKRTYETHISEHLGLTSRICICNTCMLLLCHHGIYPPRFTHARYRHTHIHTNTHMQTNTIRECNHTCTSRSTDVCL